MLLNIMINNELATNCQGRLLVNTVQSRFIRPCCGLAEANRDNANAGPGRPRVARFQEERRRGRRGILVGGAFREPPLPIFVLTVHSTASAGRARVFTELSFGHPVRVFE